MDYPLVTIIGNGFGGVYTAQALLKLGFQVRLIGREDSFTFTPLLHEVATGTLHEHDVDFSLYTFLSRTNFELVIDEVVNIDFDSRAINLASGKLLNYEKLVIATGARPRLDTVLGSQYTIPLKSMSDALAIRKRLMELINESRPIAINVIGGGFTGIELVCEIDQLFKQAGLANVTIRLFDKDVLALSSADIRLSKYIARRLQESGIECHLHCSVEEISAHEIQVSGNVFSSDLTILVAGVMQNTELIPSTVCDERRNVVVEPSLLVRGQKNVFALGDIITINNATKPPMLAQLAVQQARLISTNILRQIQDEPLLEYKPKLLGTLISLGTWDATGRIFGIPIFGRLAWYIWRTVYLFKTPGWINRFHIARRWTYYLFHKHQHIRDC